VAWAAWAAWAAWECNPNQIQILKRPSRDGLFFVRNNFMSKRYSGKSFKDSSIKKKAKLSFKEKRKLKKEKQKKAN
jgi:hypothetical protein